MGFGTVVNLVPGLKLPLNRSAWLGGQTKFGPSAPKIVAFDEGLVVSRSHCLSCHSHDLQHEIWDREVAGWTEAYRGPGRTVVQKPSTAVVTQYDVKTGSIVTVIDTQSKAFLAGCCEQGFVLMSLEDKTLIAFDWNGKALWRWKYSGYCEIVPATNEYIVVESGTRIHVLNATSGAKQWTFEAEKTGTKDLQDRSNVLVPGFPSVVVLDRQLMGIVGDGRIFKFDLEKGAILQTGQTPFRGAFQISDQSIFIFNQLTGEFSEYNHIHMREEKREDLKQALEFFFKTEQPTINAVLVTRDSIFWTTMQGVLMGIERESAPGQKRKAWIDPLGNVAMPIGVSPIAYPGYMYYTVMSTDPKVPKGLICYRPAD